MTDQHNSPSIAALRKLEAALHMHHRERPADQGDGNGPRWRWLTSIGKFVRHRVARRCLYGISAVVAVLALACLGIWLRLLSGPISLDIATPWLTAAIGENFGQHHKVEVGGTILERDANGRTAIRIRDIVVRDADGTVVASAPKAEVSVSGSSLLTGRLRAEKLSLVGAELSVRIERSGEVTVFAGAKQRPIATAIGVAPLPSGLVHEKVDTAPTLPQAARSSVKELAALLAWIDGLSKSGLDGHDLSQLGLRNGNLVVDDQRSGKRWTFQNINLGLARPAGGGVQFSVSSDNPQRPWVLNASIAPRPNGRRLVSVEARSVSIKDLLLTLRLDSGNVVADVPLSASIRSEMAPNGIPDSLTGRLVAGAGTIGDPNYPGISVAVDRAEINFEWDVARQMLLVPFQVISGGNRITLLGSVEAPRDSSSAWTLGLTGGTILLAAADDKDDALILNRVAVRAKLDSANRRIEFEKGNFGNTKLGVALSGHIDYGGADPRIAIGLAGTRMKVSALTKIWPFFAAAHVRAWTIKHIPSGTVERTLIAVNAPLSTLRPDGPPLPKDGLAVELVGSGALLDPVESLPAIQDADLNVRISGRNATVAVSRGTVELASGRKLAISNGVFEIPDTQQPTPTSHAHFRLDGSASAASELLTVKRLSEASGTPFDPAKTRGTVSAMVKIALPLDPNLPKGATQYDISADLSNFVVEKMVMGQKLEAAALRVAANNRGYQFKGDVKIGGTPAKLDYRKLAGENEAWVHVETVLDQAARTRLGADFGNTVVGAVPVKLIGHVGTDQSNSRLSVDADFTAIQIDNLLPGWVKPAGQPAHARFALVSKPHAARFEDLVIEGTGVQVKGSVEVDAAGDIVAADFPTYALSDGDKATLKVERTTDGTLKVIMRGDVYDGRNFLKSALSGNTGDQKSRQKPANFDLDVKLGAVAGFNGEALRGLDLKLSRRAGHVRSFAMVARLGVDTPVLGDLRGRAGSRQVIYLETKDAGAFFRFADVYPRMVGGQMWIAMDPPTAEQTPQVGLLNIRNFAVRGEAALDRIVSGSPNGAASAVEFTRLRVEFTRNPGRLDIRDGVVRGPVVGATIEGKIDYLKDDVHMRGTFVPLYGLNNVFGQLPIVGLFLGGGSNEGLVGITYEVVGQPSAPILRVNPISAVAPGLLRKFFQFPGTTGTTGTAGAYTDPDVR